MPLPGTGWPLCLIWAENEPLDGRLAAWSEMALEGDGPLGRPTVYADAYDAALLHAVPRVRGRSAWLPDGAEPPFFGEDVWHCYELSWLGREGGPRIAVARLRVPCDSPAIVESKSLKLYLNSFAQERAEEDAVAALLARDVGKVVGGEVGVELLDARAPAATCIPAGACLDGLTPRISEYRRAPTLLRAATERGSDCVHTNLFRSICPITGQPDWGTITIAYEGRRMARESLLAYLVSYRLSPGFHEDAVERIFVDVRDATEATELSVHGRFLRRGGIDINPFRASEARSAPLERVPRQ